MRTIIIFITLCIAVSCKTVQKTSYEHEKLSFRITDNYKIVKANTLKRNKATYIRMNYQDTSWYEYISVTWLPKKYDLDKELQNFVDQRIKVYEDDKAGGAVFGEVSHVKFASNEAIRRNYFVDNQGQSGSYIAFHCKELTVIIGRHFTRQSEDASTQCLKIIEETISCN